MSIIDKHRLIEGRAAAMDGGDTLSCCIGADNKLEKPRGFSS